MARFSAKSRHKLGSRSFVYRAKWAKHGKRAAIFGSWSEDFVWEPPDACFSALGGLIARVVGARPWRAAGAAALIGGAADVRRAGAAKAESDAPTKKLRPPIPSGLEGTRQIHATSGVNLGRNRATCGVRFTKSLGFGVQEWAIGARRAFRCGRTVDGHVDRPVPSAIGRGLSHAMRSDHLEPECSQSKPSRLPCPTFDEARR